jgi:hypothetical protein
MKSLFDTPLRYSLGFAVILAGALFFRTANLDEYFFFSDYDEYFTVKTVMGIYESKLEAGKCVTPENLLADNAQQLLQDSMRDFGNNTLYNFILGAYIHTVGFSDINLRLFSVLFGILAIILIHPIGREMQAKNHQILLAASLLAFNPVLISYSDIIRAYSWCVFLALLYFLFHIRALKYPERIVNWIWIGLLGVAMFLSHYLMIYLIGTSFLFLVYHFRRSIQRQRKFLLSYGIMGGCAALFIITNPQFIASVSSKNASLQEQASQSDQTLKSRKIDEITPKSFATGAINYLNQYYCFSSFPLGIARIIMGESIALIAGVLLLILPCVLLFNLARSELSSPIKLALWMGLAANVMVLALVILSKHSTSFSVKYTIFSLPLYLIAISFATPKKRVFIFALAATALMAFSTCVNSFVNHYQKQIALEVGGTSHEVLPENRAEINALTPMPQSNGANCVAVRSEQEVIFLALQNPDWMSMNLCIQPDSSAYNTCDFLDIRFKLLY